MKPRTVVAVACSAAVALFAAPAVWAMSASVAPVLLPDAPTPPTVPNVSFPTLPTSPAVPTVPFVSTSSTLPAVTSTSSAGDGEQGQQVSPSSTVVEVSPPPFTGDRLALSLRLARVAEVRKSLERFVPALAPLSTLEGFDVLSQSVSAGLLNDDRAVEEELRSLRAVFVEAVVGPQLAAPLRDQGVRGLAPEQYAGEVAEGLRWLDGSDELSQAARSAFWKVADDVAAGVMVSEGQMSAAKELLRAALSSLPATHVELVSAAVALNGAAAALSGSPVRASASDAAMLRGVSRSLLWGSAGSQAVKVLSDLTQERLVKLTGVCDGLEKALAPFAAADLKVAALVVVAGDVRKSPLTYEVVAESYRMLEVALNLALRDAA